MKKALILTLIAVTLFSCKTETPQEKIISRVEQMFEKEIMPNLKDPSSFEKRDIVFDTILTNTDILFEVKLIEKEIKRNYELGDIWIGLDNKKGMAYMKKVLSLCEQSKSLLKQIDTSDTSISRIVINYSYRARNSFNALDLYITKFCYIPSKDSLFIGSGEKRLTFD